MMRAKMNYLILAGLCLWVLNPIASASVTDPNIITGAVAVNGTAPEQLVVVGGGLWQGALPFVDRTGLFGDANDLGGLDYVQTAVDDKPDADVQYQITVDKAGTLYLIIDNRVGDNNADDPPTLGGGVMDWVDTNGFTETAYTVNISTPGTVYSIPLTGDGTTTLFEQNDGTSRVMYVVAAAPAGWNLRPTVTGIPASIQVAPGSSLVVDGTLADDDIPGAGISVQWTTISTPEGAVVDYSDDTSEDVTISFSEMGDYTLQIGVDDGEKSTQKTVQVTVQIPAFAVECDSWCTAGNDSNQGSGTYRHSSIHYARNHSAPRRRIEYVQYDISGQKDADQVYTNCYLTMNRDKGSTNEVLSVFALREEYDNVDLSDSSTAVWNTLPGVVNSPPPPSSDPITIETLEQSEVSPLLMETTVVPLDVWVDTPTSAGLDEFLNADNDGIITLMFVTFSPEDADFEIHSPSKGTTEPVTGLHGIILQGTVMPATWATSPAPGINSTQSKSLAQLSWTNPPAVGTITCDVYIGTGEPNYLESDYGFDTLATGVSGNSASLSGYTLELDTTYNWIVDVTDSGTGETIQGKTWNFNTNNAFPTVERKCPNRS